MYRLDEQLREAIRDHERQNRITAAFVIALTVLAITISVVAINCAPRHHNVIVFTNGSQPTQVAKP